MTSAEIMNLVDWRDNIIEKGALFFRDVYFIRYTDE
jgi:hypothetical protein